ncbi:MAG: glycogen-binding domain-containing protein [Planctomycetota bacterium]|jgi:1,4-alpha-glucan branching enzyme
MVTQTPDGTLEFRFFRPKVQQVSLAGDFNDWQTCFFMTRDTEGWWRCRLKLAPGLYEFRYSADGQWYTDYAAFGLTKGPHGFNSVLKVDPPNIPIKETAPDQSEIQAA